VAGKEEQTMKDYAVRDQVVVFMDIHDFSIAANTLGKDQYDFLQQVYEELGGVIVEHGGEILKYMGDAILCIFPSGSENQAIGCALELRETFSNIVGERDLSEIELEVGIGSGEVGIGVFGHKSLRQKDVFGEEVNRAAIIGHHRGIAVTESVYDKIKTCHKTRRLPDREVKWQDEPLKVWEIAG
jgi:class 3 adenylate cyclase